MKATPRGDRFHLLIPTQQFAATKLNAQEKRTAEEKHQTFFLEFAREMDSRIFTEGQLEALNRLEEEHSNVQAALDRSLLRNEWKRGHVELALAMVNFWSMRGHLKEGQKYLQWCLQEIPGSFERVLQARMWHGRGLLARSQNALDAAVEYLEKAQEIWQSVDGEDGGIGMADTLHVLGLVAADKGDLDAAEDYLEDARRHLAWNRSASEEGNLKFANVLTSFGMYSLQTGRSDLARLTLEVSLRRSRMIGERNAIALSLNGLAAVARQEGKHAESRKYYAEALKIRLEAKNRLGVAWSLEGVARLAADEGDEHVAVKLLAAAGQLRKEMDATVPLSVHEEYGQVERELRERLGPTTFEAEWGTGSSFAYPEAVEFALGFCMQE